MNFSNFGMIKTSEELHYCLAVNEFVSVVFYLFNFRHTYTHIIYIDIHTLTGHFIRYTLLVPGWTPFCLQNCLNSSWHRFNKMLEKMRISRSTTSQRCSIGLRSGDCGGHLSKVNSLSCSRNQSEMV